MREKEHLNCKSNITLKRDAPPVGGFEVSFLSRYRRLRLSSVSGAPLTVTLGYKLVTGNIMQNMEKYFGFRVDIDDELDPVHIEALHDVAEKIISAYDFNPEEYFVYFNQLSIKPEDTHFGTDGGLSKRLKRIELGFGVNPKQRRLRRIKLFNFLLDKSPQDQVKWTGGADEVRYYLPGDFIEKNLGFRNEIVTFISKNVNDNHRKIKVSVVAYPTDEYAQKLKDNSSSHLTQLDYKFQKPISLKKPDRINSQTPKNATPLNPNMTEVKVMGDYYNIPGQAAAVGKEAKAENTTNQQVFVQDSDLSEIRCQIDILRTELRRNAKTIEDDIAIVEMGKAAEAAESGDKSKMLEHLKQGGVKALEIGEKIGVGLVTAIIKQTLGL